MEDQKLLKQAVRAHSHCTSSLNKKLHMHPKKEDEDTLLPTMKNTLELRFF